MYLFRKHYGENTLIIWLVGVICLGVVFATIMICSGCAHGSAVDVNAVKLAPQGDMQAVKTGDLIPIKAPVKAEAKAQGAAGVGNTVGDKTAGGAMTEGSGNVNDTSLMQTIFTKASDGNNKTIFLLILLLGRYIVKSNKEDKRKMDFINKQEVCQQEYIKFLQAQLEKKEGV